MIPCRTTQKIEKDISIMEMRADKCLDTYECLAANLIHTDPPISLHMINHSDMQKKLRKL